MWSWEFHIALQRLCLLHCKAGFSKGLPWSHRDTLGSKVRRRRKYINVHQGIRLLGMLCCCGLFFGVELSESKKLREPPLKETVSFKDPNGLNTAFACKYCIMGKLSLTDPTLHSFTNLKTISFSWTDFLRHIWNQLPWGNWDTDWECYDFPVFN